VKVCATCGNHSADDAATCVICDDERQWVPRTGQRWTTLEELQASHRSDIRELQPGLTGIGAEPPVAIGQRSILVQTAEGNLLWDPSGFIDDAAIEAVRERGGLRYVTASHPHFYGCMASWQAAFDATVLVPEADEEWLTRLGVVTSFSSWKDVLTPLPGVTLIQCGGHFPGSAVVHLSTGVLLSGDTIMVTPGEDRATFAWSVPNLLPMGPGAVRGVWESVAAHEFDRVYGGWWNRVLYSGAKDIVRRSTDRYLEHLRGEAGF
jgi:glyoxylase-like metal-dependent hydrolase (beta-lactamase superfamily II)